jgi:hypothetical protein
MIVRFLSAKVLPAVAVGASAVTIYCSAAHAFFPPVPIGSEVTVVPPVTPIVPQVPPPIPPVVPPFVPPVVPPVVVQPKEKDCDPPTPEEVPEPATVMTALVGLSLLGAAAAKKKFGRKPAA